MCFETFNDFLPERLFNRLRKHCDSASFAGVRNPVDGVIYPNICTDIPEEVFEYLGAPKTVFMRLSLSGVVAPHQAHTDTLMGAKSLMLYLTRKEYCQGGTSFVEHIETGMRSDPQDAVELAIWQRDTNTPQAWGVYALAKMVTNRAIIFDASLMHRAEPIGGFGTDAADGRLVLTAFY